MCDLNVQCYNNDHIFVILTVTWFCFSEFNTDQLLELVQEFERASTSQQSKPSHSKKSKSGHSKANGHHTQVPSSKKNTVPQRSSKPQVVDQYSEEEDSDGELEESRVIEDIFFLK